MKNFASYLCERVQLRARKDMPQVDKLDDFLIDLKKANCKVSSDKVDPKTLKPTQHEFNMDKVKSMIDQGSYKNKDIVTTKDGYILDGHHRWKAHLEQKEDQPIIKVDMNFDDLYDFVKGKDYIKYKKIHEMKLAEYYNYNSNMSMNDYMTDEEQEEFNKKKVDDFYNEFFTQTMVEKVYKSMKEDGEGAASAGGEGSSGGEAASTASDGRDNENKLNSVANVSMPNTMNRQLLRRKGGNIDDDADIASAGS